MNLSDTQFTDFHVDYSHGGGCMDYITIFPPVDGQTEFCGNLIILSPGINFILIGIAALAELYLTYADLENFMLTLILMVKIVKMVRLSGKSQLYTFPHISNVESDDFDANGAIFRQRATVPISTRGACNYHFSHQ